MTVNASFVSPPYEAGSVSIGMIRYRVNTDHGYLCGEHGWNSQQPNNVGLSTGADGADTQDLAAANPAGTGYRGSHCTRAGHPCMGCTEKGYPDMFVPFVDWA